MEIVDISADMESLTKFKKFLFIGDNKIEIEGKRFIKLINEEGNVDTIALISLPSRENFDKVISHNLHYLVEDKDTECIEELYSQVKDKIYLDAIYSFKSREGNGRKLVEYIKKEYKGIWLYSTYQAEEFWDKFGWRNELEHVYVDNN